MLPRLVIPSLTQSCLLLVTNSVCYHYITFGEELWATCSRSVYLRSWERTASLQMLWTKQLSHIMREYLEGTAKFLLPLPPPPPKVAVHAFFSMERCRSGMYTSHCWGDAHRVSCFVYDIKKMRKGHNKSFTHPHWTSFNIQNSPEVSSEKHER